MIHIGIDAGIIGYCVYCLKTLKFKWRNNEKDIKS